MSHLTYKYVDERDARPPIKANTVIRYGWPEFRVYRGDVIVQEGSTRSRLSGWCGWTSNGTDHITYCHGEALYMVVDTDAPSIYLCSPHWKAYSLIHKNCIPTPLPLATIDAALEGRSGHFRVERVGPDGWRLVECRSKSTIFSFDPDKPFKNRSPIRIDVPLRNEQCVFAVYDKDETDFDKMLLAVVSDRHKANALAKVTSNSDRYFPGQKQLKIAAIRVVS